MCVYSTHYIDTHTQNVCPYTHILTYVCEPILLECPYHVQDTDTNTGIYRCAIETH